MISSLPQKKNGKFDIRNMEQNLTTLYAKVLRYYLAWNECLMSLVVEALVDDASGFQIWTKTIEDIPQSIQRMLLVPVI